MVEHLVLTILLIYAKLSSYTWKIQVSFHWLNIVYSLQADVEVVQVGISIENLQKHAVAEIIGYRTADPIILCLALCH